MKKIITLLLVLTGMVCTASSTEYTVYFKPSSNWTGTGVWYALYMYDTSEPTGTNWSRFSEVGSTGIYSATYYSEYNNKMIIVKMKPGTTDMNWDNKDGWESGNFTVPTSDYYIDKSNNNWEQAWKEDTENMIILTPSTKTFTINNYNCDADILPNFMDENSSANNNLTSNDDFTYSRTVEGNVIRKGSYGFKLSNGTNTYDNSGSAWSVSGISTTEDANYDITYSFNFITGVASATATKKADATITEKYIIAGDETLMGGHNWDTSGNFNVLEVTDGTGTLTINNLSLAATTYYYKAVKLLCNNGTKYKSIWASGDNKSFLFHRPSVWNATFTCTVADLNSATLNVTENPGYFLYGTQTRRMTESEGVYSCTLNNASEQWFGIISSSDLNFDNSIKENDWTKLIRPSGNGDKNLEWDTYSNQDIKEGQNNGSWMVKTNNTVSIDFSYNPTSRKWSSSPYIERDLKAGYATFSADYNVAIPDGITAYYATEASVGKVKMTSISDGISSAKGAFLSVPTTKTYAFTPAESVDEGTNLLEKGAVSASTEGSYNYVYARQGGVTGFYNVVEDIDASKMAGKAYLHTNESIKPESGDARVAIIFDGEGETTGIKQVETAKQSVEGYYNLAGQRVAQPTKGLYIVNGKKVIMK